MVANVAREGKYTQIFFMFAPCINNKKTLFIVPTDAHYYKYHRLLEEFKNYNTCYDMFRFAQEPSSGSSPVLQSMVFFVVLAKHRTAP
jgi:hypothetical protein